MNKLMDFDQAIDLIKDGDTVAFSDLCWQLLPGR